MASRSELITLLEREAAAEREGVLAQAREQAEGVRADARRQAEEVLTAARERREAEERAARIRAQSTSNLRAASLVLQAKEEELARVFARAEEALEALARDRERYPAALRAFIEEGFQGFGSGAVIAVHPDDLPAAEALVRERGWTATVTGDPAVRGGARIATPDGRFVVTNTLPSRLVRARPALAAEVAKTLWD